MIKCNPAIKYAEDRAGLIAALKDGRIDIIATDHAPHTWEEKQSEYSNAPAGLPLVQHALPTLFDQVKIPNMTLEQVAKKTAHNPAIRYELLIVVTSVKAILQILQMTDLNAKYKVTNRISYISALGLLFEGHEFSSKIINTFVNGQLAYDGANKVIADQSSAKRLEFTSKR